MGYVNFTNRRSASMQLAHPYRAPRRHLPVDLADMVRRGWIGRPSRRTVLLESVRRLMRPLLESAREAESPAARRSLILVTSAQRGEGKTFTAIQLAFGLVREVGARVLLVDANLQRPSLPEAFGLVSGPGLLELLGGCPPAPEDVVWDTSVPGLSLLPCGGGAVAADRFAAMSLDSLPGRLGPLADLVVIDAPALLDSAEARLLASQVGQAVLVVAAGRTPRGDVVGALDALAGGPLVLPVLNRVAATTYRAR